MFKNTITSLEQLRTIYKQPSQMAIDKQRVALDETARGFIATSPFVFIATVSADGNCDVSPKGDPAGFVRVIDDTHLVIPDRVGNNRIDTLTNLLANPGIGLLFLIPGRGDTLRVNGTAQIVADPELLAMLAVDGKPPKTAIVVDIAEVFLHCPKAFIRSGLWEPEKWPNADAVASMCDIWWAHLPQKPEGMATVADLESAVQNSLKNNLY